MKQVIRKGLKDIIVDDVPDPVVVPHHVLIRPLYSLISSGTETASLHQGGLLKEVAENPTHIRRIWHAMKESGPVRTVDEVRAKFSEYAVLGYAGAGVVIDKHDTVTDLEVGDRVAYGGEGTGHAESVLAGRNLVARVPDAVTFEHASFTTLGSIAMNAVRIARLELGDRVAVVGLGLVGQLIAQLARLQGGRVIAVDLRPERVEIARRLGADDALATGPSLREAVASLTEGRCADCVIIAAGAKSAEPARQAVQICRDRGRIVVVGAVEMTFPRDEMYLKEIQLSMSRAYGPGSYDPAYEQQGQDYPVAYVRWTENRNMEEFLRLVELGRLQLDPLITHRYPLEDAAQAYQTIMAPGSQSMGVLLRYPAAASPRPAASVEPRRRVPVITRATAPGGARVALLGAGNIARWAHLPSLRRIPDVTLHAVCSANGARGKSYAARFGAAYCCSSYDEILQDPEINVVLITTRNRLHAAQALAALEAGKHVFLEKPMALTEEECRSLCRAEQKTGKRLTVGFNRRFASLYLDQKRHLLRRTGPAVINCRVNSPGIYAVRWMADPMMGGAVLTEACHFVDLLYWVLQSEPVAVTAFSLPGDKEVPVGRDNIAASFRFADGSIGNLTYCTVGSTTSGGERVEAFASGLGVTTEDFKRLTVLTGIRRRKSRFFPDRGYTDQMRSFFSSIRRGTPPEVTARDGARATVACLRMLESARTGRPCAVDWEAVVS
ncbi:MAG: bi-domain-containing oxidoreductase [Gemmatimonadota bacterium]|nr:bi-domain-containing oxidoreductase [Gemmatimonadota bacterium]